jgi:ribosomal protein S18 acetylase RimI-like enzyme
MRALVRDGTAGVDDSFIALAHELHAGDPFWIPEEPGPVRQAFSPANPWFRSGRAATLCIPGRARLAVFRADGCRVAGRDTAFFGYLESDADGTALSALFAQAAEWAREAGADTLCGPIDFDSYGRYRLRTGVDPAGGMPFTGEPYNPHYYPRLLERAGFAVVQEYATRIAAGVRPDARQRAALQAVTRAGYEIEALDGARWLALLPELHRKADEIFGAGFAYTPVPPERFALLYGAALACRLCPRTSVLARSAAGEIAGFFLCFPDYGPLLVQGAGAGRVAAGALSYAEHAPVLVATGSRTVVAKTAGVAPAHRRRGLMDALSASAIERGAQHYDRWISALVRVGNPSGGYADRLAGRGGGEQRTYALYAKSLITEAAIGGES